MLGQANEDRRQPFLLNAWYCASWSHDLAEAFVARKILDIPILLYRRSDGSAVALKDECPHRFAPLSMGKRDGDDVVCGYHGLRFTAEGLCSDERYSERGRSRACLRAFPIVEQQNIVWIWMGDPALASDTPVPDYPFFDKPERPQIFGTTYVKANFELESDNLLDLSHLDYVHTATIAQDLSKVGTFSVEQDGHRVASLWRAVGVKVPDLWRAFFPEDELRVDTWMDMHWSAPCHLMLNTGIKPSGAPADAAIGTLQAHLATPETEFTTHYFWGVTLHPAMAPIMEQVRQGTIAAFEVEDRPMIEAVQQRMGQTDFWKKQPIILVEDGAAVRARRVLDQLIKAEMRNIRGDQIAAE